MNPTPLTPGELLELAISGKPIPADRALATFADPNNWVQLYQFTSSRKGYSAKACEWGFIGPMRPPYELAQHALRDAPDGFNFPNSERQGSVDIAELAAYVREQARVADANSKEWGKGGDKVNSAYRSGMWFAYQDVLNRLDPAAYKVTVPGKP